VDQPGFKVSPAQPSLDLTVFITRDGNELITDSRAVAIAFGKNHQHVLRAIRGMFASTHPEIAAHALSNFGQCSYVSAKGNAQPMFRMTAKGVSELVMSISA
jgi:Rha family phage regulatory protein